MSIRQDHICFKLLISLTLGLGLAMALILLFGGMRISAVQAGPLTKPLFAPLLTGTNPAANALDVPTDQNVSITFDEPISLSSVTSRTFAVYGNQSAIFTSAYRLSNLSRTVTLSQARTFLLLCIGILLRMTWMYSEDPDP